MKLKVTGMTCNHCVMAVTKALEAVPGVTKVSSVSLQSGEASVEGTAKPDDLVAAVEEEGYQAEVAG